MKRAVHLLWTASAILAVSTLVLILSTGLRSAQGQATAAGNLPATRHLDERAPALAGHTLTGAAFDLTNLRGNVVLGGGEALLRALAGFEADCGA